MQALQHDDGKFKVYGHDGEVLCPSCDPTIK